MLEPIVESLAADTDATVAKVDVDADISPLPTASGTSRRSSCSLAGSRPRRLSVFGARTTFARSSSRTRREPVRLDDLDDSEWNPSSDW
nr:hypothetical protein [Halorubrum sp. BOL3-1]